MNQPIGQETGTLRWEKPKQMRNMLGIEGKTPEEIQQMELFADASKERVNDWIRPDFSDRSTLPRDLFNSRRKHFCQFEEGNPNYC